MYSGRTSQYQEYPSTSFDAFGGLPDEHCRKLFDKIFPTGAIQDTGLRVADTLNGPLILALRQREFIFSELTVLASQQRWAKVVVLACRGFRPS